MFRKVRAALLAALILSLSGLYSLSHAHDSRAHLDIVSQDGAVLLTIPIQDDSWCLLWNHSVAGFTVSDCFVTEQNVMLLHSSHQPDFAAGLGYQEGRGNLLGDGDGGYLITQINEPVANNTLILRVGSMAVNHRVLYKGQETSISKVAAGQRVTIRLSRR